MTSVLFEGTSLLLQGDLLHSHVDFDHVDANAPGVALDHLGSAIHQAFAAFDNVGALLVVEADLGSTATAVDRLGALDAVARLTRPLIRRGDIIHKVDPDTLAIGLPGSGRLGMTRVADAVRLQVWACDEDDISPHTTVTIGAVHTTEAHLIEIDELLFAARVNLDAARAAGGNRTNWSDWSTLDRA